MKAWLFGGPLGGEKIDWSTSWPPYMTFPIPAQPGFLIGIGFDARPSAVEMARDKLFPRAIYVLGDHDNEGTRAAYYWQGPNDGRLRMRTSKKQMDEYLSMPPDQLMALPPRVVRDWLLDCQDAVKMAQTVMKYEDVLAGRLSGERPPAMDFDEINTWLGDYGEHKGVSPNITPNARQRMLDASTGAQASCPECKSPWAMGRMTIGCEVCQAKWELFKPLGGWKIQQAGSTRKLAVTDSNGAIINLNRLVNPPQEKPRIWASDFGMVP